MSVLVVYNEFLRGAIYDRHLQAYVDNLQDCKVMSNSELLHTIPKGIKKALFLDKDVFLCKRLEKLGIVCYNSSSAIDTCDSKALTYLALSENDIMTPKTIIAPFTYDNVGYNSFDFLQSLKYPIVIKESYGSFGEEVFLAENLDMAIKIIKHCKKPILQEYIHESKGMDIRVIVLCNEVIACMKRTNTIGDFRSNIFLGGKAERYTLDSRMKELAISSARATGCVYCGVDILLTGHVLEVNSNPHMNAICDISRVNCYKKIAEFITQQ